MPAPLHDNGRAPAPGQARATAGQAALREAATRTAALLRTVPDGAAAVPGLDWNVGETAAHLLGELRFYTGFAGGDRDAREYLGQAAEGAGCTGLGACGGGVRGRRRARRPSRLAVPRRYAWPAG